MDKERLDVVNAIAVGTASVNWGFDPYYTWVKTPPFERMLDEMVAAGYGATEISYHFPEDVGVLRDALARRGLSAAATFHAVNVRDRSLHDAALASSERVADRLQALGSNVLILSDEASPERLAIGGRVAADGSDGLDAAKWETMGTGLNRIGARLAERGMRTVFHPHVGTYVETFDEIRMLCEATDPSLLALCPDTGHLAYAGADPEIVFKAYASRIGYVHLKDVDGPTLQRVREQHIGFAQAVELGMFVEFGKGIVPIPRIVELLRTAGYSGWIIVEQDAPANPLASAKSNRRYLAERCGL